MIEFLKDKKLYMIIERTDIEQIEKKDEIIKYIEDTPSTVHNTLRYLTMQADALKQEKLRIAELQKAKEAEIELIKETVKEFLEEQEKEGKGKTIETEIGKLSLRRSPGKVNIKDITRLEDSFFNIEKKPNLLKIKRAIEDNEIGEDVADMITGYSLMVK